MRTVVLIAALLPLAACDSGPDVEMENASVAEVAREMGKEVADDSFVRPGLWSTSVTVTELEMPGMPAEVRESMRKSMTRAQGHESCLTPEQAKRPNEDFFAGAGKACRYDHFKMGDGKIDAKMRCQHEGVTQQMEMAGTYSPDSYTMNMTTRTDMPDTPMGAMTMKMTVESKRVGECPAASEAAG